MKKYQVEVIEYKSDLETGYTVRIDGMLFPLDCEFYITTSEEKAIMFAFAERDGKYLSRGGVVYDSREDYLKKMEEA